MLDAEVQVVTDSTCDLSQAEINNLGALLGHNLATFRRCFRRGIRTPR